MLVRAEASYAADKKKEMVPVRVESDYQLDGWLGIVIAGKRYIDVSDPDKFDTEMEQVVKELRIKLERAKAGLHVRLFEYSSVCT